MDFIYVPVPADRVLDVFSFLAPTESDKPDRISELSRVESQLDALSRAAMTPASEVRSGPHSQQHRASRKSIERAKPIIKRFEDGWTAADLTGAMEVHQTLSGPIIRALIDEGWVEQMGKRGRSRIYRYLPAKELPPQPKQEDDLSVTGTRKDNERSTPIPKTGRSSTSTGGDLGRLINTIRQQGWLINKTGKNHLSARKNGKRVILPSTPSDHRALANARAELRRKGANV